ncbi:MAG TPA: hypothetical protein VH682_14270 [Gemmataceae bacterium]|jgi:hypothetical protein
MNRWLSLALVLLLLGASRVHADLLGFGPSRRWDRSIAVHPSNAVPVVIQAGTDKEPARLVIPCSLLEHAKKAAPQPPEPHGSLSMPIFVVAVLILSAGGLGLVCLRGYRFTRAPLMFLVLLIVAGACTSMLWANAPPPYLNSLTPLVNGKELKLDGVRVEITADGDTIRLIVPRAKLAALSG